MCVTCSLRARSPEAFSSTTDKHQNTSAMSGTMYSAGKLHGEYVHGTLQAAIYSYSYVEVEPAKINDKEAVGIRNFLWYCTICYLVCSPV